MSIAATTTSARYQPLAQIGRGGMAEVILAEMQIGRGVTSLAVLKRLWPELAEDSDFVSMFLREARLAARMNHPNVVRTYEVVEDAAGAAIAMEYLDGQPLARVLNRLMGAGTLGLASWLRVLIDVLAALDYAHELRDYDGTSHGIVHRDVNPQNVFITYDGMVKLLDFGVAKSARDAYQTRPGELRGKLAYLAPEQALGEVVDRRADVFSVGVMLWEMVTGRRMWQSLTETSIMRQLTLGAIPPLPRDAAVPAGLVDVCACALARTPARRFATAGEFAAELQRLLPGGDESKSRHLGRVVGLAFAPERAARRTLIEEHLRRARSANRDVDKARWTIPPGAAGELGEIGALPQLRTERATPGGMWTLDEKMLAEAMEVSADDLIDEPVTEVAAPVPVLPPPTVAAKPTVTAKRVPPPLPLPNLKLPLASRASHVARAAAVGGRLRRVGWMAVGFAAAGALGAISYAGSSAKPKAVVTAPAQAVAAEPLAAPPTAPVRPLIVNAPIVCSAADAPQCSGAVAAPVPALAPSMAPEPAPVPTRRHRRRSRTAPVVEVPRETPHAEPVAPRPSRARFDDETLEPTVDLTGVNPAPAARPAPTPASAVAPATGEPAPRRTQVRAIDVADPFQP